MELYVDLYTDLYMEVFLIFYTFYTNFSYVVNCDVLLMSVMFSCLVM